MVFFSVRFQAKITVILVLLTVAFAINFRLVNHRVGSAITIVSWYGAMILGIWRKIPYPYYAIISVYAILTIVAYFVLRYLESRASAKHK